MRQFVDTLGQIAHSDSVGTVEGTLRHLHWQARKMFRSFPCEIQLRSSRLYAAGPDSVAALVNAMGAYDFNNMTFLQAMLRRHGGVFFDVGANVGSYTLIASEMPSCRVVSIEPHPRAFALLEENVRRNSRTNVIALNVGLSNSEGECFLTDGSELSVNHVVSENQARKAVRIRVRSLRSLCDELGMLPDFVKIDVEGHELFVLDGFAGLASAAKAIWIEGGERSQIKQRMQSAGYSGPFYIHYKAMRLSSSAARRREDPVFLRRDFVSAVEGQGFRIGAATQSPADPAAVPVASHGGTLQFR